MTERPLGEERVERRVFNERAAMPESVDHRTVVGRHRRATTRARILRAAASVYAEKGPDAPVIDDFVKAAGLSRGTFYNHFTTTAELLDATIDWLANELDRAIVDAIGSYPDLVDKAAMVVRIHLHWITSDPALCAFFARVPRVSETGRREARAALREGMASGVFNVPHLEAACDLVFGLINETVRRVAKAPSKPTRCHEVVTIMLTGLGVDRKRIEQVMAMPLPAFEAPFASKQGFATAEGHVPLATEVFTVA